MQLAQQKRIDLCRDNQQVGMDPVHMIFQVGLIWPACKQVLTALTSTASQSDHNIQLPASLPKPQGYRVSG